MTTQLATGTAGYRWPGEDLSSELFLRTGTGAPPTDAARASLREAPAPGVWAALMNLVSHRSVDLDALRQRVEEALNESGLRSIPMLLDLLFAPTNADLSVQVVSKLTEPMPVQTQPTEQPADEEPVHSRLAREVREMTNLPTASLASAFGVTREQYQRWLRGSPISNTRYGQLIFLHTIVVDLSRRLGDSRAQLWWLTPTQGAMAPEQLLKRRRLDQLHRLILAVPDPEPIADGVLQTLPLQEDVEYDHVEDDESAAEDSWSPYGETSSQP